MNFDLPRAVREFHRKHGYPVDGRLPEPNVDQTTSIISKLGWELFSSSKDIEREAIDAQRKGDERLYRVHMMVEELGELLIKMSKGDEAGMADGIADLMYVLEGTALCYGIPTPEILREVHRSNMTKQTRDPKADARMRCKGPEYSPPSIVGAISAGRERLAWEQSFNLEAKT